MDKIKITCDSTCDLTRELYETYHIDVLPLGVCLGDAFRQDGVNVTAQELYDYAEKTGTLPKTSAISMVDYAQCFRKYTQAGYSVIHISLSGALSSCYQNACMAASAIENVYVIDSQNLSTGSGQLALLAAELANADYTAKEIPDALEKIKPHVHVSFVLDTLEYLHKGGRCSGIAMLGANLLKLHPEIIVSDGNMHVGAKYRGNPEKAILSYVRGCLQNQKGLQLDRIFITHSGVPAATVQKVRSLIEELQPFEQIIETKAGSTISSHCGPGCLGLAFITSGN